MTDRNLRLFLLGSALGIVCHQRGLFPLHVNAVIAGGRGFAFAGPSGSGKSTLAAYFERAGYPVLCDDTCAISFDSAGQPHAWPGLPRIKLWSDAAVAFGHDPAALDRVFDGVEKFQVALSRGVAHRPVPLHGLYLLRKAGADGPRGVTKLRGQDAMAAVMEQTYRREYLGPLGLAGQNFHHCAALLAAADIQEVRREWGLAVFKREARMLEEHMLAAG